MVVAPCAKPNALEAEGTLGDKVGVKYNIDQCAQLCAAKTNCVAFDLDLATGDCHLRSARKKGPCANGMAYGVHSPKQGPVWSFEVTGLSASQHVVLSRPAVRHG